jgi:hypothetical protein
VKYLLIWKTSIACWYHITTRTGYDNLQNTKNKAQILLVCYLCSYFYLCVGSRCGTSLWRIRWVSNQFGSLSKQIACPVVKLGKMNFWSFSVKFCQGQVGRTWVILIPQEVKRRTVVRITKCKVFPFFLFSPQACINMLHMSLAFLCNIQVLATEVTVCWLIVCICQYVYISFVFLHHCCQVILSHR